MKTNRDKYEHYRQIITNNDAEAISELLPNGVPRQFFQIEAYEAKAITVSGLSVYHRGIYTPDAGEKMTKAEVECAKQAAENWQAPTLDEILVCFLYKQKYGTVTGAHKYSKMQDDPAITSVAWTAEELQPEIERRRSLYAPRDGCKACEYCRKQTPEIEMVKHTIFYRDVGGRATKTGLYCSSQCGGYDQMGHEG